MPTYFLGIAGSKALSGTDTTDAYWCVPATAEKGDVILLYHPRSISYARHGVFAEAVISAPPSKQHKDNPLCSGYGLLYVPIKIHRRFRLTVTAKDMKCDPILRVAPFVRRNFQGTSFRLEESHYKRIVKIAETKMENA